MESFQLNSRKKKKEGGELKGSKISKAIAFLKNLLYIVLIDFL